MVGETWCSDRCFGSGHARWVEVAACVNIRKINVFDNDVQNVTIRSPDIPLSMMGPLFLLMVARKW